MQPLNTPSSQPQPPITPIIPLSAPTPQNANQPQKGKALSITALVFSVLIPLVGFILSIIALFKASKKTMAIIALIISIVWGIISTAIGFAIIATALVGIQNRANTEGAKAAYDSVITSVNSYETQHDGMAPTSLSDLKLADGVTFGVLDSKPSNAKVIEFDTCGESGARLGYWDYTKNLAQFKTFGTTDGSDCVPNQQ